MGNCTSISSGSAGLRSVSKKQKLLPIDSTFTFPAPFPTWPPGGGFATGTIDLGGLIVAEVATLNKLLTIYKGGPDNAGTTFFEPTEIPEGFSILGHYAQPNNRALFGSVLVGKDATTTNDSNRALALPADYVLVWSSQSLKVKQDSPGYIWAPVPQNGYNAVGLVVTTTSDKPPLDKVRCVRSDLTATSEPNDWIWGPKQDAKANHFNIYKARPTSRGIQASAVSVGTFMVKNINEGTPNDIDVPQIACLTNANANSSSMPNLDQIKTLIETYSPKICMHPNEEFLPSSVDWFFTNGALLYKKDDEPNPIRINPDGSNLPQGGSNDGSYWLDIPRDNEAAGETLKKGNLESATAYIQIKPMLGGTHTDIAIWLFYPFNGPARAKAGALNIPLGKIGEHVGDWEHITLRISNFNGVLRKAYFSQHSSGKWVQPYDLEFQEGSNQFVAYASLHGHGNYPRPGVQMQGTDLVGIRNDTGKSEKTWETSKRYKIVSAEYLGEGVIVEPHWLNYKREWGPRIRYDLGNEIDAVAKSLTGKRKNALLSTVKSLPNEVLGEQGPTGPKMKDYWYGDER